MSGEGVRGWLRSTGTALAASCLLCFFLFACLSCLIVQATLLSPAYYVRQVGRGNVTALVLDYMHEIYRSYGSASGFEEEFMVSLITWKETNDALTAHVRNALEDAPPYDFAPHEARMLDELVAYAQRQGVEVTPELEEGLREMARVCTDSFRHHTTSSILLLVRGSLMPYKTLALWGAIATGLLAAMAAVVLYRLRREKGDTARYIIYALGGTTLLCAALPVMYTLSGLRDRILVGIEGTKEILRNILGSFVNAYIWAIIPLLLLIALCAVCQGVRMRRQKPSGAGENEQQTEEE